MMSKKGYAGTVTLYHPDTGQMLKITVPERRKKDGVVTASSPYRSQQYNELREKASRRLNRLLSKGWRVVKNGEWMTEEEQEEWKKFTDEVNGSTQTGFLTHGGQHNSGEVDHQAETPSEKPSQAQPRLRTNRAGRRYNHPKVRRKPYLQQKKARMVGHQGVYSPTPLWITKAGLKSAEESAKLLQQVVGRATTTFQRGTYIDIPELLVALELNDNPIPALEKPRDRPTAKVLVTPDCSGSTQDWSGLGQAWAKHLSKMPDVEAIYLTNVNGSFSDFKKEELPDLLKAVDIVLYLGDGDGYDLCESYAQMGATVIALDTHCSSYSSPQLVKSINISRGHLYWIIGVSARYPGDWTAALQLVLEN